MRVFFVYFRYKQPNDKKPGPVRHVRVYANSKEEARRLAAEQARYPDLEILDIREG